ncbi:hypothetical protein CHN50_01510 [Priestia aryabhattai]|nr:hypothetical protein CHN50_01510 [Priestia aryabhattai]TDB54903.1 hypothetical protein EPL02_01505 [Bacillus sp. CBEL-1]
MKGERKLYQEELKEYAKLLMPEHVEQMKEIYRSHLKLEAPPVRTKGREVISQILHTACEQHQLVNLHVYEGSSIRKYNRVTIDCIDQQSNRLLATGPYYTYSIRESFVVNAMLCID